MRKRYPALVLCCAGLAVAGCGGSGSSGTGTNQLPKNGTSAAVFSTALNQLCKAGNAAEKQAGNNPAKVLAIIDQYLPKFKALSGSPAQQAVYAKFLANIQADGPSIWASGRQLRALAIKNRTYAQQLHAPACA